MTEALTAQGDVALWPVATTLVLFDRPLNPNHCAKRFSLYGDDSWDVTPALFEAHAVATKLDFTMIPATFRDVVKSFVWRDYLGGTAGAIPGRVRA